MTGENEVSYEDFISEWHNTSESIKCTTSGSTGKPKAIWLPKEEMRRSAWRTIRFFGLDSGSHIHSCISPDFIGGKMMAVRSAEAGCRLTWETPSNRPLSEHDGSIIDLLAVVPSQMLHILDNMAGMPPIRSIIIGGSPIAGPLRTRIAQSGLDAWETYGMTETASHIALRKVTEHEEPFKILDGIKIRTDSDDRLIIGIEGWQELVTNDIAHLYGNGKFSIIGRSDNVIISGGKKIHPEQVEETLEREFGTPVMISSRPDDKWGERVIMIIEDKTMQLDDINIISRCKKTLPKECAPKEIIHGTVPRTANGKKRRK